MRSEYRYIHYQWLFTTLLTAVQRKYVKINKPTNQPAIQQTNKQTLYVFTCDTLGR